MKRGLIVTLFILGFIATFTIGFLSNTDNGGVKCKEEPKCKCSEKKELNVKNVSLKEYKGDYFYILDGEYDGEYDVQYIVKGYEPDNINKIKDEVKLFNTEKIMSYDEYSEFCERWNLEKKYDDEAKKYAIVAYLEIGSPRVSVEVANVLEDETVKIYMWDEVSGYSVDIGGYFLAIPVSNRSYNLEVQSLFTKEEFDNYKKYGSKQGPYLVEDKPIIYIYPEKEMEVSVKLGHSENLLVSYPKYNNGWKVVASPDGTLKMGDRTYYGLYWEGSNHDIKVENDGFIVKGEDSIKFLEEKLAILGLTEREANEFIVYWLPKLEGNKYNYIRFETEEEINEYMPLEVNPTPESVIRIVMDYKPLDEPIKVKEQKLTSRERTGYTVVEWGGSLIK